MRNGMGRGNFKSICTCLFTLTLAAPALADQALANPKEGLMLRRITEYWRDGDYTSAKRQILEFLEKNPESPLRDPLSAMLGDLYFQAQDYRQALATYDLIVGQEIRQKTFFNNLQAHFEMKDYNWVIEKAENFLKQNKDGNQQQETKVRYLLAEGAFRQAMHSQDMQKRVGYLKLAKPHFKILTQTEYGDRALFPLAETYRLLKEDDKASVLYGELAIKFPVHRERFLFQAGLLQINHDKSQAIKTFHQVYEMGGKRAKLAVFNELILLYQNGQFDDYLALYPKVINELPNEKAPLLQFYEGRSFYAVGSFEQAVTILEAFVESKPARSKELKTALLLLVNCATQLKDGALLDRTMFAFKANFPKDRELAKIIFAHAQFSRDTGNFAVALQDLKLLASDFPDFEERELVIYDMGLILEQTDQFQEGRETFLAFIEKFPESSRQNGAWRHLINCCIEDLKNPSGVQSQEAKENFVRILDVALKKKELLTEKEQVQYGLTHVKFLCDLGRYEEAMPLVSQFLVDSIDEDYQAEANLLMAICEQKINGSTGLFIAYSEKALHLKPHLPQSDQLHLELYNAYLNSAFDERQQEQKGQLISKAANHLFDSGTWKTGTIKRNNLIWLTHYYYEKGKVNPTDFKRAASLFNSLLGTSEGIGQLRITPESIELEGETLKFAHLLSLYDKKEEQIALLEALVRKQETLEELPWKLKRRAILELAKAYEANHQYENAMRSYQFLAANAGSAPSTLVNTAQLQLAKLQFKLLPAEKKRGDQPEVVGILHRLKDIQIQKRIAGEPVHLEAALQYAELRTLLADPEKKAKTSLFFLQRMQEDFNSEVDVIASEYNEAREHYPEKNLIFNAYMSYVKAQILMSQAELARDKGNVESAERWETQALKILDHLLESEDELRPYLLERVKSSQSQIRKI